MKIDSSDPDDLFNHEPDPRPAPRWKRSGREQFVEAAVSYLDELGDSAAHAERVARAIRRRHRTQSAENDDPEELGIRLVAKRVFKSPSAPLFHFPDRTTLLAAVAAEGFRRLTEFIRNENKASKRLAVSHRQVLVNVALSYVDWAGAHPALWAVMYTPALAPGVDAIQSGDEDFWGEGVISDDGTTHEIPPITAPAGRRRLAYQELHDAKASAVNVFWAAVEAAQRNRELSREAPTVEIMHAVVTMADGLAWQRVNEHQQTVTMMRQYAERAIQLLLKGIG